MMDGEYLRRNQEFYELENQLLTELRSLRQMHMQTMIELRLRCIEEHGSHKDDGGFMMGSCVRCGESLG